MFGRPRMGSRDGAMRNPPVSVGEELDVTIEAVGEKGDGIAKKDGFILFVKGTKQGERCRIKISKVLQKVGFADKVGPATGAAPAQGEEGTPAAEKEEAADFEDTEDFGEDLEVDEAEEAKEPSDEN